MTIEEKTPERLKIEDAIRQALEKAALTIEQLQGNATYTQAWRLAARAVRSIKPI